MASSFSLRRLPLGVARRQVKISQYAKRFQTNAAAQTQNPVYPLYPSVTQLLHEKGVPDSEISKIPATGPKGRLLKGDVLAYLGSISAEYPSTQAARIAHMAHLDLSNIKVAAPKAPEKPAAAAEEPLLEVPPEALVAVPISLASVLSVQKRIKDTLGVTVPLSSFIARATDLANDDLPRSPLSKPSADELFDEILGAAPIQTTRGSYIPEINTVPIPESESYALVDEAEEDIVDFLTGTRSKRPSPLAMPEPTAPASALNVFSLTVPAADERRAKTFLDRMQTVLTDDPGRLVL